METEVISREKKCLPVWVKCVLALVIVGGLYVLSFGPIMRLEAQGHLKNHKRISKILALVYAPIVWSHHHTFLRGPIEGYVRLWLPPHTDTK